MVSMKEIGHEEILLLNFPVVNDNLEVVLEHLEVVEGSTLFFVSFYSDYKCMHI